MLAERMEKTNANCWLINTGWTGGKFGTGKRCPLKYTRAIVDAIHDGSLAQAEFENFPIFNLAIPKAVNGVPSEILHPAKVWPSKEAFQTEVEKLGGMFQKAFAKYEDAIGAEVKNAGPILQ
jgi:phosphoenolpyruvate carboxykinase (ATP)